MKRYTVQEIENITKMYNLGLPLQQIAESVDRTVNSVRGKLYDLNISKGINRARNKLENNKEKIIELWNNGLPAYKIAKQIGVSDKLILELLRSEKIDTSHGSGRYSSVQKYSIFEEISSPEHSYWLGFLYADASINKKESALTICLNEKDVDHLFEFANFIGLPLDKIRKHTSRKEFYLIAASTKLCSDLKKFGIVWNKTYKSTFQIPDNFPLDFIRGFLDGDGYINPKGYSVQFTCSKSSSKALSDYLKQLNFKTKTYNYLSSPNVFQLHITGKVQVYKLLKLLYLNSSISLNRKQNRANIIIARYNGNIV